MSRPTVRVFVEVSHPLAPGEVSGSVRQVSDVSPETIRALVPGWHDADVALRPARLPATWAHEPFTLRYRIRGDACTAETGVLGPANPTTWLQDAATFDQLDESGELDQALAGWTQAQG